MKRTLVISLLMVLIVVSVSLTERAHAAATPAFTTLQPGQFREVNQNLQINVVFVGYEPGAGRRDINEAVFRAGLPGNYRSAVRDKRFYGLESHTGANFTYQYNIAYANAGFENAYFSYLASIATPKPRNGAQDEYNEQASRSLDIDRKFRDQCFRRRKVACRKCTDYDRRRHNEIYPVFCQLVRPRGLPFSHVCRAW